MKLRPKTYRDNECNITYTINALNVNILSYYAHQFKIFG